MTSTILMRLMWNKAHYRISVLQSQLLRNLGMNSKMPLTTTMANQQMDDVIFQEIGTKKIITLNRPKALNALNLSMISKIYPILKKWKDDESTSLVIIRGTGDKAFCAGGDIRAVCEAGRQADNTLDAISFFREEYKLNYEIGTLPIPYVALIGGITMGGGVGLSVHGKYRIATEKSTFAMPETGIGLFPDVGGSYFLPRLSGKLGLYLALTGQRLTGEDVYHAGIATHFVHQGSGKLDQLINELLSAEKPNEDFISTTIQKYHDQCFSKGKFSLGSYMPHINTLFAADTVEGIIRQLSIDKTDWSGKTLSTLQKMSPVSLKVTMEQLRRGSSLNLAECLKMELRMTRQFLEGHDFYEGVRAVLIDKDNKPSWKPAMLDEVTDDVVASFFRPLPEGHELKLPMAATL